MELRRCGYEECRKRSSYVKFITIRRKETVERQFATCDRNNETSNLSLSALNYEIRISKNFS